MSFAGVETKNASGSYQLEKIDTLDCRTGGAIFMVGVIQGMPIGTIAEFGFNELTDECGLQAIRIKIGSA